MLKKLILLIYIAFLIGTVVIAQTGLDDQGKPNDPNENERANACYEGGSMEDKCDTDWEWMCGWYIIRLDPQNEASRAEFPPACINLLPPQIIVEPVSSSAPPVLGGLVAGCYTSTSFSTWSVIWNGGNGPQVVDYYLNNNCAGAPHYANHATFYFGTFAEAVIVCQNIAFAGASDADNFGVNHSLYKCI